jgi:hypothetical protein
MVFESVQRRMNRITDGTVEEGVGVECEDDLDDVADSSSEQGVFAPGPKVAHTLPSVQALHEDSEMILRSLVAPLLDDNRPKAMGRFFFASKESYTGKDGSVVEPYTRRGFLGYVSDVYFAETGWELELSFVSKAEHPVRQPLGWFVENQFYQNAKATSGSSANTLVTQIMDRVTSRPITDEVGDELEGEVPDQVGEDLGKEEECEG